MRGLNKGWKENDRDMKGGWERDGGRLREGNGGRLRGEWMEKERDEGEMREGWREIERGIDGE